MALGITSVQGPTALGVWGLGEVLDGDSSSVHTLIGVGLGSLVGSFVGS